ncbi:MAG: HAD-IA family hydrolase [Thermoplasmata archaeon]
MASKPYVLFDFGETLVDLRTLVMDLARLLAREFPSLAPEADRLARDWIAQSWREMPRAEGVPFVSEFQVGSTVLSGMLRTRGLDADVPRAGTYLRRAWDAFEDHITFCPGVSREWLEEILGLSAALGIVTDGDDENVSRLIRRLKLESLFACVVTSESVRAYKPNPRIYRAAMEAVHAEEARTLFVSDSPLDLQGAAALGMGSALLLRDDEAPTQALPEGTLVLHRPAELNAVLEAFPAAGRFRPPTD